MNYVYISFFIPSQVSPECLTQSWTSSLNALMQDKDIRDRTISHPLYYSFRRWETCNYVVWQDICSFTKLFFLLQFQHISWKKKFKIKLNKTYKYIYKIILSGKTTGVKYEQENNF